MKDTNNKNFYDILDKNKYSPMIRQYLDFKQQYLDTILFYRVGDFYELFFNDALVGSKELEIVLTGKDAGVEERVPMCGVPFHAVDSYLDTLVSKGYKVAIVEQVEDPSLAKGIVKRAVTRIVTPGTNMDVVNEEIKNNNYLVSISFIKPSEIKDKSYFILSYVDLTTGEGYVTNIPNDENLLYAEIIKLKAKEIVLNSSFNISIFDNLRKTYNVMLSIEDNENVPSYFKGLIDTLDTNEAKNYCRLLNYIVRTQMRTLVHMQHVIKYDINSYLKIDVASRRNLELLETLRFQNKQNTLISVLDKCQTAMGSRYLKKAILFPYIDKEKIERRFDIIDLMRKSFLSANDLREELINVYDLERILGKVSYESVNPHDLLQLRKSLKNINVIKKLVKDIKIDPYFDLDSDYDKYLEVYKLIDDSINLDAPFSLKDGNVIKAGYNKELDEVKLINSNSKEYILSLEAKEKERTGLKSLRVGYNRVFGYYIEVSKLQSAQIKDEYGYIRKQTTANTERYITQELKEKEAIILRADEKILSLEASIFASIREEIKTYTNVIQRLAKIISEIDMMLSFTKLSKDNRYVRPKLNNEGILYIKDGRHPVLDNNIEEHYIPNDTNLSDDKYLMLITGPNMSGKSTYMRQVALICIMAQIGSFVPCKDANLPIFDAIFTRIGASDDIVSGQSTFMVEMMEVNNAISNATANSLILFDEIGRGTATFDGMALAQAIIEHIHENIKCKTLFSTHYHELTDLSNYLPHLVNYHVSAEEINGEIVFLHKLKEGPIDKSYGINVAKLANLPLEVIVRAKDILNKLEENEKIDTKKISIENYVAPLFFDSKSDSEVYVLNEIKNLNIYEMSPIDAMNKLNELKKKVK